MASTTSQFAGGIIPQDDGYMPGDSAWGNPVRQLGSVRRNVPIAGGVSGPHVPIVGVVLIAGLLAALEWRRLSRMGRRL